MISVLILTKNEERNLPACLDSVRWSDDIVVLDSGSSDRTIKIAVEAGARVFHREYDDENHQRTFSIKNIEFKYSWVYNPDADEITLPELRDEMLSAVASEGNEIVAYRVRFKTIFMGKWLRYSSLYPTWVVRLFRPEFISFGRTINLQYLIEGPEGRLRSHFLHYSFNKGIEAWFAKHNHYSSCEAAETLKARKQSLNDLLRIFSVDPPVRRKALKDLSLRLPLRPLLRFVYMYVLRAGFLDGLAGLRYCCLLAIYEYMIVLKAEEMSANRE